MGKLLVGKKVLITGAGRGIGAATAKLFAAHGAELYLNARDEQSLTNIVAEIKEISPQTKCILVPFDVSEPDAVKQGFSEVFKQAKSLDVLVNNAGVLDDALIGMVSVKQIERTFSSNSFSVIYCSQYASRLMQRSGGGSIINLSSIIGRVGNQGQAVYGGSKAAVIGITQSLAKELAAAQIRVNAVAPGFIETPMTEQLPEDKYKQRLDSIAMGRIGSATDVANSILFLASDMSTYVTGQVLGVDGGMLI